MTKALSVLGLRLFEAAFGDDLGERAVRGAELEGVGFRLGEDLTAVLLDRVGESLPILDLQSPMMDARAGTGELRLRVVLAVVDHEGEIDVAVGHVPGSVAARMSGLGLIDAEDVLVELGRLFQVIDLEGNVNDAGHGLSFSDILADSDILAEFIGREGGF